MTNEDAYYLGWAEALLYTQAHNDVEGGQATLTTHLPAGEEIYAFWDPTLGTPASERPPLPIFNPGKLDEAILSLNDECLCTAWRYHATITEWHKEFPYPDREVKASLYLRIEIASTEGHHGVPWYTDEDDIVEDPTTTGGQS
jgi:hypothetical protein